MRGVNRDSDLLSRHIQDLRNAVRHARACAAFHIDAWVVLPEHLHALWTLPEGDANCQHRWQAIKMAFSKGIAAGEARSPSRLLRGERGIWQRRYWEHTIRDNRDYAAHMDYIHFNPVKHGLVANVADWPFSTFHRSVAMGLYPPAWASKDDGASDRGERP